MRLQVGDRPIRDRRGSAMIAAPCDLVAEREERLRYAMTIWQEARSFRNTLAVKYLTSRGIRIEELPPSVDDALRFHPNCPFGCERHPCMVALMRDVQTDEPRAIQRTA